MLFLVPLLAQSRPAPPPQEILQPQEVRPLPGHLDTVPVFNSNSPELVSSEGILLSTFPPGGKRVPAAHLNFQFRGRFDVFAHHIAKAPNPQDLRSLYLGVILYNPSSQPVTVSVLQAASYLTQPDAPFIPLPSWVENPLGSVFSGPGSRVSDQVLRGQHQPDWPALLTIPPQESQLLMNLPILLRGLTPPLNGRSTLVRLRSSGPVYAASLALFGRQNPDGSERPPTLVEWQNLLETGNLVSPRDRTPNPPDQPSGSIVYGRVAGVAQGSRWQAQITDRPSVPYLTIPAPGQAFSYGLSTLKGGALGTGQIQSAPMLARYPDTAYRANGNYGIEYNLTLPLRNRTQSPQTVTLTMQTPLKQDQLQGGLRFLEPLPPQIFFRGTVRIRFTNNQGLPQTRYVHLVQQRGQKGEALATVFLPPQSDRLVQVDWLYPPDATPPQVLTIETFSSGN
ncbi:hypothetical protein DO97_21095 [Neosynechococcus sphagnicola sy1]|uniref:DUF3370 domain-containing protein n=1 Tax=Neosynechococcus sphagnicola sy1 TaxID=1497020 RepID=A0A098TM26_9CYAN|nr:DUF3370 domain-containing protein [Neosynechococcus sphagnicola]KGF73316.1 hypothetical protein DO97_21095 [Neosynechococcus sphagnicola sy1]